MASQQATATERTAKAVVMILNYCATYLDAVIRYYKSDMVLHVHSDSLYLSEPEARSRADGHFLPVKSYKAIQNHQANYPQTMGQCTQSAPR
eukprot:209016-Ditylum_brightwellii.AAC.1